jgi:hypothetical protein
MPHCVDVSIERALKKEAAASSKPVLFVYQMTQHHIPEDYTLNIHCCENGGLYRYVCIFAFIQPTSDIALKSPGRKFEGGLVMKPRIRQKFLISYLRWGFLSQSFR